MKDKVNYAAITREGYCFTLKNNSKALEEIKHSLISEDNTTIEQD